MSEKIKSHHLRALASDIEDCHSPQSWADYCRAAAARIAELEAVLDFYACVDHYQTHNAAAPNVVQFDRGAKARAALERKKDE